MFGVLFKRISQLVEHFLNVNWSVTQNWSSSNFAIVKLYHFYR